MTRTAPGTLVVLALCSLPLAAQAQGTWLHTQCLAGSGDRLAAAGTCKATPAWGQTGLDHVQALAAAAGPGNLGLSLAKPETLPAANAARAQLAAVMLGYLDSDGAATRYRWFGPVAPSAAGPRGAAPPAPTTTGAPGAGAGMAPDRTPGSSTGSPAGSTTGTSADNPTGATAGTRPDNTATPAPAAQGPPLQAVWRAGAWGDEPQTRSASWWLAGPYLGLVAPVQVDNGSDPYRVLRFLAAQCPQLEGKVAPNAWTRCTQHTVPEPASAALAVLALVLLAATRRFSARWLRPGVQARR